ncbi:MAG: aminopeptidase [Gammaproteobacteria bacterium]|nr:aminopeptidase [Gammaproteobacteria bacterium]
MFCLLLTLCGCANPVYYIQAAKGQIEILHKRRAIEEILTDPTTPAEMKSKLALVMRLREFASQELLLPDNRSYRSYADLQRPFAVWNVFAAPELSLEPKKWCFIVTGCVPYRGYFARAGADQFAAALKQQAYDVYVGGVPAYSTLGWFDDPLLNTFIQRSEAEIAGLLFHELAHQKIYVSGATAFNESFATAVELEGVKRWFEHSGSSQQAQAYRQKLQRRDAFVQLVVKHRSRLKEIYTSSLSDADKRAAKARTFADLRADYATLKQSWDGDTAFDGWFKQDLNNAHLAAVGLYTRYVEAFQTLLAQQGGDLGAFYREVQGIKQLPSSERAAVLKRWRQD